MYYAKLLDNKVAEDMARLSERLNSAFVGSER